jgi:hypothetical protein
VSEYTANPYGLFNPDAKIPHLNKLGKGLDPAR